MLSSKEFQLIKVKDEENVLLNRREIRCIVKDAAGKISRKEFIELIKRTLNTDSKVIVPVSLKCQFGKTDVDALVYIYDDVEKAKRHLPPYILRRIGLIEDTKKEVKKDGKT